MKPRSPISEGNCKAIVDFLTSKGREQKVEVIAEAVGLSGSDTHNSLQLCLKDGAVIKARHGYYKVESEDDRWEKFCTELRRFSDEHRILLIAKESDAPVPTQVFTERLGISVDRVRGCLSFLRRPRSGRIEKFGFPMDTVLAKLTPQDYGAGPLLRARDLPRPLERTPVASAPPSPFVSVGEHLPTEEEVLEEPEAAPEPPAYESNIVHYNVEGFDFLKLNGSPECRLTSELLTSKLDYAHRQNLEQLAHRHVNFLNAFGGVCTVHIPVRAGGAPSRMVPVPAYNRDQVLYLIAKSEQPVANQLTVDFIRAYRELERRYLTGQSSSPVQLPNFGLTPEFQRQVGGFLETVTGLLRRFLPQ